MAEGEEKDTKGNEEKSKTPFFVWPWKLCTEGEIGPYWKGALMCIGMFGTAAGVQMCEPYPIWCLGSAAVALGCSVLAQAEIYRTANLKKIHHGLEDKNKVIEIHTEHLTFSMGKNKEQVEEVFDCENLLGKQLEKLEKVAGQQTGSKLTFNNRVKVLFEQREKIKVSYDAIDQTLNNIFGADRRLDHELDVFKHHLEDLTQFEKEVTEDLKNLKATYNILNSSKQNLEKELKAFHRMKKVVEDAGCKWTKDIIGMTESMKGKYQNLFQLCMTFSTNYLKEMVHNIEYMDDHEGWTWDKFQELMRRLPNNIRAKADFKQIRQIFRVELIKAKSQKHSQLLGYNAVAFEVFQKEIVQKLLLPLCDVLSSGTADAVIDSDSEMSELKEVLTSAVVEL